MTCDHSSAVKVASGVNQLTHSQLAEILKGIEALDRTTINAWEDNGFVRAVETTGRKKLLMAAL
jgi:hypothetical protein